MKQELHAIVMPDGALQLEWKKTSAYVTRSAERMQAELFRHFTTAPQTWLLRLGFCDPLVTLSPSLSFFRRFTGGYVRRLTRTRNIEQLRERARVDSSAEGLLEFLDTVPMISGAEYITPHLLQALWDDLNNAYAALMQRHEGSVKSFVKAFSPDIHLAGRVYFHLVENKRGEFPFAFLATYAAKTNGKDSSRHLPLKHALEKFGNDNDRLIGLLAPVQAASEKSAFVADLYHSGELLQPMAWSPDEALLFLKEVPLYEDAGIFCRIPDWWKGRASGARLSLTIGEQSPSLVGLEAIIAVDARLMLGDVEITREEAAEILQASDGLSYIKNRWVAVDPEKLQQTLKAYEKAMALSDKGGVGIMDALRLQLGSDEIPGVDASQVDASVSRGRWLEEVLLKMREPDRIRAVRPGKGFSASLRTYQQKGLDWLCFLHTIGFGACLADDMGLGKTVQLLAFLSVLKSREQEQASLLVLPASLVANWIHEIQAFFPDLLYYVAHPGFQPDKKVAVQSKKSMAAFDLVITTYTMARKYEWIGDYHWKVVILDEAQAIKNPGTRQTRAIKTLKAGTRIIMTGTPVENRLSDLWSLLDFVNPGLLGNRSEFSRFTKGLKDDPQGYKRLRRVVGPYILRRLKTDKSVIPDLPDKVEMKTWTSLSKKQVVLYTAMVRELAETVAHSEGIQRRGLVLASLMKCKQLCNHPDQYLGSGGFREKHSGKFSRLREICETIRQKRERVLVFTQFKEMTAPLDLFLAEVFGREGIVFHGSIPVAKRKNLIAHFQGSDYVPYMVLSLKAGGVGLNLTRANHVVHFDRWWNPAVENQATDRAFRIGQEKKVVVHKFLTRGTIEEKIDHMLEEKRELSDKVVAASGEGWITEMDNDTLMDLFTLSL